MPLPSRSGSIKAHRRTSSFLTRCWRKTDSNLWFRISGKRFFYTASEPQTGREPQPVLTTDNGRFTVGRTRLAPAMISTPGHRASRRRQREALPAWCNVIGEQLHAARSNPPHNPISVRCNAAPSESGSPGCNIGSHPRKQQVVSRFDKAHRGREPMVRIHLRLRTFWFRAALPRTRRRAGLRGPHQGARVIPARGITGASGNR
jgi:hypothetical protein